jgi:hypothetical protein
MVEMKKISKEIFFGIAFLIRLVLVYYAKIIDEQSTTKKYTDTDYDVFTDGA